MVTVNNKKVGPIGLGLMSFTSPNTDIPFEESIAVMKEALNQGCNLWNGAVFYSQSLTDVHGTNSVMLLRKYLEKYPEDKDMVFFNLKGGYDFNTFRTFGDAQGLKAELDASIQTLEGTGKIIDAYGPARRDPNVPLAETLTFLDREYVQKGLIGGIALSEVSADTLREAAKITKIVSVELELSLWSLEAYQHDIIQVCVENNIPVVAYSPLGHGFFSGAIRSIDDIPADDMRRQMPRFQPDAIQKNVELVKKVEALAAEKGVLASQLAINWVRESLTRSRHAKKALAAASSPSAVPAIIPIPGTKSAKRVRDNAKVVELSDSDIEALDKLIDEIEVIGTRYPESFPTNT